MGHQLLRQQLAGEATVTVSHLCRLHPPSRKACCKAVQAYLPGGDKLSQDIFG